MRKTLKLCIWCVAIIFLNALPIIPSFAKSTFVTIGTGGITATYYSTGGAIARIINKKRRVYGIRCNVESTGGSVFNINAISGGDLELGIVQSDRQYQAWAGLAEWKENRKSLKRPKAVPFTEKVAADIGRPDEALESLVQESKDDYEPSPLNGSGRNPIVRPSL